MSGIADTGWRCIPDTITAELSSHTTQGKGGLLNRFGLYFFVGPFIKIRDEVVPFGEERTVTRCSGHRKCSVPVSFLRRAPERRKQWGERWADPAFAASGLFRA